MQDRFKFRAIVKGYYYIDKPDKCEEFEPLIFLENIDVLDIGDIGISEEDLEIAIRKQYPDLQDVYIERIMENFRDNSNGIDTYITITPERVYQCTGLKDNNGKLIYEGDIVKYAEFDWTDFSFKDWETEIAQVVWGNTYDNYYPAFDLKDTDFDGTNAFAYLFNEGWTIEVISNIYQNPELLED